MDKACSIMQMVGCMWENGGKAINKDMALTIMQVEMFMQGDGRMAKKMDMAP